MRGECPKYPRRASPNHPANYGLKEIKGADGKVHIEATEETIEYMIDQHYFERETQALPIWED